MNRPLRLLNLIRSLDPATGGPAEGLRQSVQATRALGHVEEVVTLDAPDAPWLASFPARVQALGPAAGAFGRAPALLPWLRQHAGGYDAAVVHGLWQYHGLIARRALQGTAVPYFVYPHGMLDPWFRRRHPIKHAKKWLYWMAAERAVLRDAAAVLFTTEEERRLAQQTFPLYRAHAAVVGYGVAPDPEAAAATAEDFLRDRPLLRGRRLLLFLARLHPKKGCDLLLRAFAAAAAGHPRWHLVVAGPDAGGMRAELEAQAIEAGIADRVSFTGLLQGAAKWGALRAADAFVLPSHQENFGVAVAEALAMGVPALLSTQVNIWREVVQAGAGLAEPDTQAGTERLLRRWMAMPEPTRQQMRRAAVPCFDRHFHVRASAARLLALVQGRATAHDDPPIDLRMTKA